MTVETRVTRAESSLESLLFPGAESRVISLESRVELRAISFESESASHCQSVSSHVSSHYSAVGRVNVTKSVLKILK